MGGREIMLDQPPCFSLRMQREEDISLHAPSLVGSGDPGQTAELTGQSTVVVSSRTAVEETRWLCCTRLR
jgi:hypothetical protein